MTAQDDVQLLARNLGPVETQAASLPWSAQSPWHCTTHLGISDGLPLIDLHGLSVRLGLEVVEIVLAADLATGGVLLVTGRGRHSGGRSRLREAVIGKLEDNEVPFVLPSPGRVRVVLDETRYRRSRPGMGLLFWLFVVLLLLAVGATLLDLIR